MILFTLIICFSAFQSRADDKPWPIDKVLGKANAPITVIEYASLGCIHCAHFHNDILPKIQTEWIDTGKVKLIFRDFPLDTNSQAAAMIAHCSQDRYFAFIDTFYKQQNRWASAEVPMDVLTSLARFGGMGKEEVTQCMNNTPLFKQISQRKEEAIKSYKVDSTPSFVIGGKTYSGALEYDVFSDILRKLDKN
jgi:protein-disulfide isomerase